MSLCVLYQIDVYKILNREYHKTQFTGNCCEKKIRGFIIIVVTKARRSEAKASLPGRPRFEPLTSSNLYYYIFLRTVSFLPLILSISSLQILLTTTKTETINVKLCHLFVNNKVKVLVLCTIHQNIYKGTSHSWE